MEQQLLVEMGVDAPTGEGQTMRIDTDAVNAGLGLAHDEDQMRYVL